MKLKMILIYICSFTWSSLYAKTSFVNYSEMEPMAIKFFVMGCIVPFIAIYMLFQDENARSPTKMDIAVTVLISTVLVWMGYEVSNQTVLPVYAGLIISFFLGLFSLELVLAVKKKIFGKEGLIDRIFTEIGIWISKKLGNGK